eukprot:m.272127 g.272127  ORF g.272127 m.272127 type:complete len:112 (-) comp17674_c2_seq3:1597-1932(-)
MVDLIDLTLETHSEPEFIDLTGSDDEGPVPVAPLSEPSAKRAKRDCGGLELADCPICYEALKPLAIDIPLCCGRAICAKCSGVCLAKKPSVCPFCRKKLRTIRVKGLVEDD